MSDVTYPNDVIDSLMTTRAIRRYTDEPIADEHLEWCLRCAQQAPSGGNVQPQQYVVLTEPEVKAEVGSWYLRAYERYQAAQSEPEFRDDAARASYERTRRAAEHLAHHIGEAPAIVLFLMPDIPWGYHDDEGPLDIGRLDASVYPAVQNFCLAARSLGLGTSLTTMIRIYGDETLAALGVPTGRFEIAALVPVGYPTGNFGVAPRKPVDKLTHWNRWGQRRSFGAG